ncbi:MAG TPA: hypothetical protein ENJ44_06350 [Oceanospirillales bacterium]|nr:hypothetical protein [Oceanospirillales bacterium]
MIKTKHIKVQGVTIKYKGHQFSNKGHQFPNGSSWDEVTLEEFKTLKAQGIESPDFVKIAKEVFAIDNF